MANDFNYRAFDERQANNKHITRKDEKGTKVLVVDTSKATFKGQAVSGLNQAGRRKFENNLVIDHLGKERTPIKVIYR